MVKYQGQDVPPQSNFDLLIEHLPKDSLAATFVTAHVNRGPTSSVDAMRRSSATSEGRASSLSRS